MGHLIFLLLHFIAVLFFPIALVLTIPLHLIYSAVGRRKRDPNAPTVWTHVKCPDCKELVNKEASVCKHCGCKLVPASEQPRPEGVLANLFAKPKQSGIKRPRE